jgi:amidophosphoribosyltransferase
MSDPLKHECGIAVIRLLKPLSYYKEKYGTALLPFHKLFLLMEKQHNRGQDGAGVGGVKHNMPPGQPYMFRARSDQKQAMSKIFKKALSNYEKLAKSLKLNPDDPDTVKKYFEFGSEVLLGHLRYGTSGGFGKGSCHPYFRKSNWPAKNLMLAGNFNMTNSDELNQRLIARGQHPIFGTDTQTILEEVGYHLDHDHEEIYRTAKSEGLKGEALRRAIGERLDPIHILQKSAQSWDGGYTIGGLMGNGDMFVLRDPHGIRPCFYFQDDEFIAFASERVPLMTVFDKELDEVKELEPGCGIAVKKDGEVRKDIIVKPATRTSCSFERIYFSRGNDADIYKDRKALGAALVPSVISRIGNDFGKAVFSYIPNTSEVSYYGFMEELRLFRRKEVRDEIMKAHQSGKLDHELLDQLIMDNWPRGEKIANKDIKLRTFISQEKGRSQLVSHVYDITYGVVGKDDALVCVDDSIVRGTTLKRSVLKILSRTNPRKIVIASTAPQIRYPDCYGIDMSELGKFIAFQAAVSLLKDKGMESVMKDVYKDCLAQASKKPSEMVNHVKRIYDCSTADEISAKISELVYPQDIEWNGPIDIVFQSIEDLHKAIPEHSGDWYFTGTYPTPGGYNTLNKAFINYFEDREGRSY